MSAVHGLREARRREREREKKRNTRFEVGLDRVSDRCWCCWKYGTKRGVLTSLRGRRVLNRAREAMAGERKVVAVGGDGGHDLESRKTLGDERE